MAVLIVAAVLVLLVVVVVFKSIALVPQAEAAVIERLGRYSRTVSGQLTFLVPFADRIRAKVDLRERVVSFPPQPVITQDNLTLQIDSVVYFQVTSPQAAVYEISNYIAAVEQLTVTTLRNVVGGMTLEDTLTSRDQINSQLRGVLDEATGRWGLRVARVELKAIDPPPSIQESMEKQMKADREKRAMILTAEGQRESQIKTAEGAKQAQILSAEGAKQSAILSAEGERQSRILRAQGERAASYLQAQGQAKAIEKVFAAIKSGKPTPELLAYQYMQTLPMVARGDANKVWLVPSDFGKALEGFAKNFATKGEDGVFRYEPPESDGSESKPEDDSEDVADWFDTAPDPAIERAVRAAEATARTPVEGLVPGVDPSPANLNKAAPTAPQSPARPEPPQPPSAGDIHGRPWQPPGAQQ
ncbi:SPFH domain-containing protein [Nocardia cyriacigeorgica]|uniref:SPFH domain-containing protein n=1 Tax=Nocardia cyriacigeorgica TaxID=135487 RepID=UPI0013D324CB|nr:SPFH domain-containing protein [Nocardia cyriacigeorgica]MBF6434987.1 SPFH/Band 7/PHB domain protein [Nocardia cyriacigeorgica]MBF6454933.1 SPFH/Band 7/PHB domain protein [Nocardia cyriacigeorgica]MBF6552828.1 SPFH/Band 7/PHB domain protein [Nocardia cyriacigeorgica]NEW28962.1 SPFH/Band 7/PHB domain protein [Nocardia cyriacigeorgica]